MHPTAIQHRCYRELEWFRGCVRGGRCLALGHSESGINIMLTRLTSKLSRMANGKVLICLSLAALPFILFIFPYRTKELKATSGESNPTLDSDFFYTPREAYELFGKLKPSGRRLYLWTEITADLIYPVIYSLLLSLLIIYIFRKFSGIKLQQALATLPLTAMLFDYCENVLIAIMLFAYPQERLGTAYAAGLFTKLKWIFVSASLAAILFGLVYVAFRSRSKGGKDN